MNHDTKTPYPPPQAHAAPVPAYEYNNTTTYANYNPPELQPPPKNQLRTMAEVKQEWRYGSKSRVFKYYIAYALMGFAIGAIIGVIIGVVIRFA
ncbi:hypothetical protein BJX63DRAFT_381521 [Aspergillus granulosus]|uniref:Uncharacterized protein n=1 Tax=Aspergillus granulosus TaxID=176169 RepID=A0ABR4HW48_9EURO